MSTKKNQKPAAKAAAKTAAKPVAKKAAPATAAAQKPAAGQQPKAPASKTKPFVPSAAMKGAFGALGKSGEGALAAMFAKSGDVRELHVDLSEVEIVEQEGGRDLEDGEQTLADLGKSLRKLQLQNILLRIMPPGHPKPYRLVAGERRVRGAMLEGLPTLRALAKVMTDEEAAEYQFVENIQRKNLTQIEEARRVQKQIDALGSVDAFLEKYNKQRPWLSKMLSLLHLPEQTKRLITEAVSADLEVISNVRQIEKVDPKAAAAVVDDLKQTRGKEDARAKSQAAKDKVKPPKKEREAAKGKNDDKGSTQEQKDIFADAKIPGATAAAPAEAGAAPADDGQAASAPKATTPRELLGQAYEAIFDRRSKAATVLEGMSEEARDAATEHLLRFYEAGKQSKDTGRAVIEGFRAGHFSTDGDGAFALVSFLHGADTGATFNLLNVLGAVKE